MTVSAASKALLGLGEWASDGTQRATPESFGLDRAKGWTVPYEQHDTGRNPERLLFNQRLGEITAALVNILTWGILPWDEDVDYQPPVGQCVFVVTGNGIWRTETPNGPSLGGVVDPDTAGQTVWKAY